MVRKDGRRSSGKQNGCRLSLRRQLIHFLAVGDRQRVQLVRQQPFRVAIAQLGFSHRFGRQTFRDSDDLKGGGGP